MYILSWSIINLGKSICKIKSEIYPSKSKFYKKKLCKIYFYIKFHIKFYIKEKKFLLYKIKFYIKGKKFHDLKAKRPHKGKKFRLPLDIFTVMYKTRQK